MVKSNKSFDWTREEVEIIVQDYFDMFRNEMLGLKYNKSSHRRRLIENLNNRSHGSIERKHQNISAVLISLGLPYIQGYKPLSNFQKYLLPDVVQTKLSDESELLALIEKDVESSIPIPKVDSILLSMVDPPIRTYGSENRVKEESIPYRLKRVNYLSREANNKAIGNVGENFALEYERVRLISIGKEKLADQVEQVSLSIGDSAGYDIHSYEKDGTDRFIEVKSTKYGKATPIFISANEVKFSANNRENYFLYRVFSLRKEPKMFFLQGFVKKFCNLKATQFIGHF